MGIMEAASFDWDPGINFNSCPSQFLSFIKNVLASCSVSFNIYFHPMLFSEPVVTLTLCAQEVQVSTGSVFILVFRCLLSWAEDKGPQLGTVMADMTELSTPQL